jgi:glycosidase
MHSPHEHASRGALVRVPRRGIIYLMLIKPGIVGAALAVPLLIGSAPFAAASPWTMQNSAWNVNLNPGSNPTDYYGAWSNHVYFASPDDWRKVPVYQFITDRFCDGEPANNELAYPGYDLRDVGARHGGDFLGVRDRLEYIRALGYKAIWISPVFQNRTNSYHGYGAIDFTLLDERFGTVEDFRAMVAKAHSLGLYVIVDIVVNHLENLYYFEGHPADGAPFHLHDGEYRLFPRTPGETYVDFPVDNTFSSTGQYCDVFGDDGYRRVDSGAGSYWSSDLHHNGDLNDYSDPWQDHLGKIYGSLDDLRTTHPRVQDKIIAMTKALVSSCDIDGIRMDTPMQVPRYFFQRWCPAVKAHAAALGKSDFFIFGEFYCARERAATMVGRGKSPNQYGNPSAFIDGDFTMAGGINYRAYFDFFQSAIKNQDNVSLGNLNSGLDSDLAAYDFYDPAVGESRYTHLNFYNNHDQWRMVHNPAGAAEGFLKTDLASGVIAFWPGLPLFYYGDEQGFCSYGTALDGWSREDFMTSLAWDNAPALVTPNPAQKDNFDMANPHYLWVQKCMNVREKYAALQTADTVYERWRQSASGNGIYIYSRAYGTLNNWVMVAFNTWRDPLSAGGGLGDLYTGWNEGDVIVNALNPAETYTLTTYGKLSSLSVDGYGMKVFVQQSNLKALNPVVTNVVPAHDARLIGSNAVLRVQFSDSMDEASVKGAFCYDGQPIAAAALSWNPATRELTFSNSISDGIHVIEVTTNALSTAGLNLFGKFRSRFLVGDDANILVNRAATNDLALVNNGAPIVTSTNVTLYHKAVGAQKFRTRNETSPWSAWQSLTPATSWTLSPGNGAKSVQVQYWADGSAAYFVTAPATLQQDWRISAVAGQNAKVVTWPSVTNRLYTVTWSTNALGPWTPLAIDLAPTPPQNSYTDAVHAADAQAYYRVSVRIP